MGVGRSSLLVCIVQCALCALCIVHCAGPKTNWIVGPRLPIGVDNETLIIDKLKGSGEVGAFN